MNLRKFFDTAWERHRIYILKELSMPKPWTECAPYLDYRFCNVFRRLDKTSKWIINNAIEPNKHNPNLWKTIFMCRYISRISTLQELKNNKCLIDDQRGAYKLLREMQHDGTKIFTDAFIVNSKTPSGWTDKVTYLFQLLKEVYEHFQGDPDEFLATNSSMEWLYGELNMLPGIGPFMAYQYAIDFTYSNRYLAKANDTRTWTALGLGAVRGMNRLLTGMPEKKRIPNEVEAARIILGVWEDEVYLRLKEEMKKTQIKAEMYNNTKLNLDLISEHYFPFKHLTLMEVEHWLCEYDKYCRGGSKKRRYYGHV